MLTKIKYYSPNRWTICGDLKILNMLLGHQGGYTKYFRFLCVWDSGNRAEYLIKKIINNP